MSGTVHQRLLANNRNLVRTATLTPSSVQPVANYVQEVLKPRTGTAQVKLTGSFTDSAEALYDLEVLDTSGATNLVSQPIFAGEGSGGLGSITASSGLAAQTVTVSLAQDGVPGLQAKVNVDGLIVEAAAAGNAGNDISIHVDNSGLTFSSSGYSLVVDLAKGGGSSTSPLTGVENDFDSAILQSDGTIPSGAHRVAFGLDHNNIYLQYKSFADGKWQYFYVPELQDVYPKGTEVFFVTGGRTVTITDGVTPETYTGVVTLYDFLNGIKTTSALCDVDGAVANDRTPGGMASRELDLRTDAHALKSYGTGSAYAQSGFTDIDVGSNADTELITAECFAVTAKDYQLAHLGKEFWKLKGSLSGDLGVIFTDQLYTSPGAKFTLRIPQRLPASYGLSTSKGRFTLTEIDYQPRAEGVTPPPICPVSLSLGPEASDQSITLTYKARPSGDCVCDGMPKPNLNTACLGNFSSGGDTMGYQADTITKLTALYDWYADYVRQNSQSSGGLAFEDGVIETPPFEGPFLVLKELIGRFESVIAVLDPMEAGAERTAGMAAWDTAVAEMEADVESWDPDTDVLTDISATANEALTAGDAVVYFPAASGTGHECVKAFGWGYQTSVNGSDTLHSSLAYPPGGGIGFVTSSVSSGSTATIKRQGDNVSLTGLTAGTTYYADRVTPGSWTANAADAIGVTYDETISQMTTDVGAMKGFAYTASHLRVNPAGNGGTSTTPLLSIPTERYLSRLNWVLITAGISPLGKTDASTLQSGDGCWKDYGDTHWWEVVGSDGAYAPLFTNKPYYSCRKADQDGMYYSTHEFALQLNVKCDGLVEGDRIVLAIGASAYPGTYQTGDIMYLPLIKAGDLHLTGGQDASPVQTWNVRGDSFGPFADYLFDPTAPAAYGASGLGMLLSTGGIPYAQGDKWTFKIERARYRWRKNGGSWSSTTEVPTGSNSFDAGLSLEFITGDAPSFVAGDTYQFRALQPWAVTNLQTADDTVWKWTGSSASVVCDFGSAEDIDHVALAYHTIPAGSTITLSGGSTSACSDWSETVTWQAGVIHHRTDVTRTYQFLKIAFTSATGGTLGWPWAGAGLYTDYAPAVQLKRNYSVERSTDTTGLLQGGSFLGKAISATLEWTEGSMSEDDATAIGDLLDWVKSNDDEPLIFIPNYTRDDAVLGRVLQDEVELTDSFDYHPDASFERRLAAKLEIRGVWEG